MEVGTYKKTKPNLCVFTQTGEHLCNFIKSYISFQYFYVMNLPKIKNIQKQTIDAKNIIDEVALLALEQKQTQTNNT